MSRRVRSLFTCPLHLQQPHPSSTSVGSSNAASSVSTSAAISVAACQQTPDSSCRIVATHTANICHLISHALPSNNNANDEEAQTAVGGPAKCKDAESRVVRCRVAFDREVGAVAVSNGNNSPVLLVGDVSGRLWMSRPKQVDSSTEDTHKQGIAFAEGWLSTSVGSRDAATSVNIVDDGPPFDMIQLKPGRGHRRCLPLGVDQMSICQTPNDGGSSPLGEGILMVAAGSKSMSPPSVIFVSNTNDSDLDEEIIVQDIRGLESTRAQIVSTLMVASDAVGAPSWRSLLRAMTDSKNTINGVDSAAANSAVFLGMSDGSIYCSLVSVATSQVCEGGSNRLQVESLRVTLAKQIHCMTSNQGVASMFLIPNEPSSKNNDMPTNLLAIVGRLGSISVLNYSLVSSPLQTDAPLFISKSTALPRIGTCTSACPYQPCRMEQDMKKERNEFAIMTTFDDGSSYLCPLAIESFKQGPGVPMLQNRSPATRLPIRRDAAVACSDLNAGISGKEISTSSGVYIITFSGSLVGLRAEIQGQTRSSQVDQSQDGIKASDGIMTALKRLCDATNMDTTTAAKGTKSGIGKDGALGAIQETRDAGRVVSQQKSSRPQGKGGATNTDKWFQTRHLQKPMLSDLVGSQPSSTEDLPPLYYVDHDGDSIKVAYAGVTLNECTSLQQGKSFGDIHQFANQWNSRPMTCSSTLSCTFEHSTKMGVISNVRVGTRVQDDAPSLSNKKRKLQSLTDFLAGRAKSAYSSDIGNEDEILGLVAANSNPDTGFPKRWSIYGDAVSEMLEDKEHVKPSISKPCTVGSSLVEAEGAMIQSEMLGRSEDNGETKKHVTDQSILLSSCSAIAKKIAEKKKVDLQNGNASGGLGSVSIEAVPSVGSNDDSTRIRYGITSSRLESDGSTHSSLPLLRSCIIDLLAERVSAPGEASIPLGEMEAATLLDSYHKAIKNPRTKKMAMYLVMKADELLSKMKRQSDKSTEDCGGDDESVDAESVYLLYNQLRAIPLPLG